MMFVSRFGSRVVRSSLRVPRTGVSNHVSRGFSSWKSSSPAEGRSSSSGKVMMVGLGLAGLAAWGSMHAGNSGLVFEDPNTVLRPAISSTNEQNITTSTKHNPFKRMNYDYVIIGSGTAAYTALEAIRQMRPEASLLLISEDQQLARLDVDIAPEHVSGLLQDVYNEWRRHIACQLDTDETPTRTIGNSGVPAYVRKWGTRRDPSRDKSKGGSTEDVNKVSVLITEIGELRIDPEEKMIQVNDGTTLTYTKCLLAPPGKPRDLYVLKSSLSYTLQDKINTLRNLQDFQTLNRLVSEGGKRILVVGGGYLGTTLCAAIMKLNRSLPEGKRNEITQTFVESGPLDQYFPSYLSSHILKTLCDGGLKVYPDRLVTNISRNKDDPASDEIDPEEDATTNLDESAAGTTTNSNKAVDEAVRVTLMQGSLKEYLDADYVVLASTNVEPDVTIARLSGLEIDKRTGGIAVNSSLEAYDGLFVAGSAASYYDPHLGRRRVDFYDNALNTGLLAGQNMACDDGRLRRYYHQPTLRCTLPGTGLLIEAVGDIDSNLQTVGMWLSKRDPATGKPLQETAYERGIVYYVKNNIVVGVLCCNASECLEVARDVLRERLSVHEAKRRIMLAPEQWIQLYKTR